jgi:hypothetical protein
MNRSTDLLTAARAEALFTSPLSASVQASLAEVTDAIHRAVRAHGGTQGCAIEVAGEYGEHPDTAARRMRWALQLVEATYADSRGHFKPAPPVHLDPHSVRVEKSHEDRVGAST